MDGLKSKGKKGLRVPNLPSFLLLLLVLLLVLLLRAGFFHSMPACARFPPLAGPS